MRVSPLFILDALVVAGCAAAAQPATAPGQAVTSGPVLVGIHAFGPQADLNRLEAFATGSGFPSKQMSAPKGWELVIAFPPGSDPSAVGTFIERLRTAEFSSLRFKSAIAPSPR